MKLIEQLEVISDYANVIVEDYKGTELARYDGGNSIPTSLNHTNVLNLYSHYDGSETWIHVVVED